MKMEIFQSEENCTVRNARKKKFQGIGVSRLVW
jgi:hypothetical protein